MKPLPSVSILWKRASEIALFQRPPFFSAPSWDDDARGGCQMAKISSKSRPPAMTRLSTAIHPALSSGLRALMGYFVPSASMTTKAVSPAASSMLEPRFRLMEPLSFGGSAASS